MSIILPDNDHTRAQAARIVRGGGIIAFRTDTFYGLGVDPFNEGALKRLKKLKGREDGKPILVVIGEATIADKFFAVKSRLFDVLSERHWPGPLTLILDARDEVSVELTAGTRTIGVRLPDDDDVRAFVNECGGALTATSANAAGKPPARSAAEVFTYFPAGVTVFDGGASRTERPSTVLDLTGADARLLREGVVTRGELSETLRRIGATLK
ncbi:MAG: L-threonylcarbamoyladenylate synthase [Pyrinomonadaceae bacterium]